MGFQELDQTARHLAALKSIEPMPPDADLNASYVRGQDLVDGVVALSCLQGKRIQMDVSGSGAMYTITPADNTQKIPESSSSSTETRRPSRSKSEYWDQPEQKPPSKSHALGRLTGFYKGTFYKNGIPRKKKS